MAYIKAISYYLPEKVVSNEELVKEFPEWSVEKVAQKVGVDSRHVASENETAGEPNMSEFIEKIKAAGIVGAGGAGFPTDRKLDCRAEVLIINAIECEPLLRTDRYVCEAYADRVVKAAQAIKEAVQAERAVIAIHVAPSYTSIGGSLDERIQRQNSRSIK